MQRLTVFVLSSSLLQIKKSTDIVIIGGGPVGVELSGEIGTDLPDKKVTLIHSKPSLIGAPPFSDSFVQQNHDQLGKLGVTVLLGGFIQ